MNIKFNSEIWSKINQDVFVVAEIGKNFIQTQEDRPVSEYLENAKLLVWAAKKAGADAVKFQTHIFEDEQLNLKVVSPHFKGADRYSWVKRNTLATPVKKFWLPLKKYCQDLGITFFSTPMSRKAAILLDEKLSVNLWKVGSGDILDFVLLDFLASTGKPIIISTGMSTLKEIDLSVNFLKERRVPLILLYCVSQYPCPPDKFDLNLINFFENRYQIPVGFSDHSIEGNSAIKAVESGAKIIEKHFSLSRHLWGSDHKASLNHSEFETLIQEIRKIQKIFKPPKSQISPNKLNLCLRGEAQFRPYFRKSLMAGQNIKKGARLKPKMIYAMRPQKYTKGIASENFPQIVGKKISKNLKKYQPITFDIFSS